jgi:hypothetical protein
MRRTSSGRQFPPTYVNGTAESAIIHVDDVRAMEELQELTKHDRMISVVQHIKSSGYKTPFDFILELLQFTPREDLESLRGWLRGDGMPSFIDTCTNHSEFRTSDRFRSVVLRLAKAQFTKEMHDLNKCPSLRRPISSFNIDQVSDFSLDHFGCKLRTTAPTLLSLLESLALPAKRRTIVNDSYPASDEDSDDDDEPAPLTESIANLPEKTSSPKMSRSRRLAVLTSMSALLYAQSQKCNLVPGLLGYFLYAFRTPKRVIEALHRLGICISYESVISGMKSVAADSSVELRKFAADFPPLFAYLDNMNVYKRVRDQRLDNQAVMDNSTVGYIGLNPHHPGQQMLNRENPLPQLSNLGAEHLLPTSGSIIIYSAHCWTGIWGVLDMYCGSHLRKRPKVCPRRYFSINKLSQEPTKIFTLPAYDKNEAVIEEMTEVLRLVMKALGYTREDLVDRTLPFSGDYLTIRNIRF